MIEYIEGDIFSSPAQVIVNAVNTVGVMGKGIALEYKERYPDMFEAYRAVCDKNQFKIGQLMIYYDAPDHWILLFPTKENWRNPSKLEYIEAGLAKFVAEYAKKSISSIAFPKLGCGNGELDWDDVKKIMEAYLGKLPINVYIYLGMTNDSIAEHRNPKAMAKWLRENAKDMSANGVVDDIMTSALLLPISFVAEDSIWTAQWKNDELLLKSDKSVSITENEIYEAWDDIKNIGVIVRSDMPEKHQLLCALLKEMGYLSSISVFNSKTAKTHSGYQVNEGLNRVYSLQEAI